MRDISNDNFGLLIAYLLPGFVAIWGLSLFSPGLRSWLSVSPASAPTVGGFLFISLGSTAAGVIVSAIRWAVVDRILHRTGVNEPRLRFANLREQLPAFRILVEFHYRYYQFHANMLVALLLSYAAWLIANRSWPGLHGWLELGLAVLIIVLWLGARDTLRKYYQRIAEVIGEA